MFTFTSYPFWYGVRKMSVNMWLKKMPNSAHPGFEIMEVLAGLIPFLPPS